MSDSHGIVVSVVVPIYNDIDHVQGLLGSLLSQSMNQYEIVIVDDQSDDGTWEKLSEFSNLGTIRLCRSPRNGGSGLCRNLGVKEARGRIVVFTDSDCVADEDWLTRIVEPIIGEEADASFGPNHLCLRNLRTCRLEAVRVKQYGGMDTKNMAIRKDVLLRLSGFREDIRLNVDAEFHRRFTRSGYRAVRTDARVLHDFPDDVVRLLLGARMRGRQGAKIFSGSTDTTAVLRFLAARALQKLRRSRKVWAEGRRMDERLAMVVYYLSFHAFWNGALAATLLTGSK